MISKELESIDEIERMLYPPIPKSKKKNRIKKFFTNETVVLTSMSLVACIIIIILFVIAGSMGIGISTMWWA